MEVKDNNELDKLIRQCAENDLAYRPAVDLGERARTVANRERMQRRTNVIVSMLLVIILAAWFSSSASLPVAVLAPKSPMEFDTLKTKSELERLDSEFAELQAALVRYESTGRRVELQLRAEKIDRNQAASKSIERRNRSAFQWLASSTRERRKSETDQLQQELKLLIETFPGTLAAEQAQVLLAKGW